MSFRTELTVRFGDIDHAGVVYYPRFFHYFHIALEELFSRSIGLDYNVVLDDRGVALPTVNLEVDFIRPLRFGDRIDVLVEVLELGSTSVRWCYTALRDQAVSARAKIVTVCVSMPEFEPTPLPDWLREGLGRHLVTPA